MAKRKKPKLGKTGSVYKASDRDGYVISWMGADGKRKRKTIKAASESAAQAALLVEKGRVLKAKNDGTVPSEDSFAAFACQFLMYQKGRISPTVIKGKLSAAEYERQRGIVEHHLVGFFGPMKLVTIRRADVISYITSRTGKVSDGSVIKEANTLKKLFNYALDLERVEASPAIRLKNYMPKAPEGLIACLSPEQWKAVFRACHIPPTESEPVPVQWLQHVAGLCLSLGTRRGELMDATIPDVDLELLQVTLRKTKNGKPRTVPINSLALQVFEAMGVPERKRRKDRGVLFPDVTPEQVSMKFIRACRVAGVENFSIHSLRHTYASFLRLNGADLFDIQKLLGHSDPRMTQRYTHLSSAHLAAAASRLDGVLTLPAQAEEAQVAPQSRVAGHPDPSTN